MALQFLVLTAARTGEVLGARWSEIDLAGACGRSPLNGRNPAGNIACRCSRPPLQCWRTCRSYASVNMYSPAKALGAHRNCVYYKFLRGFRLPIHRAWIRSGFRDWAAERTAYPREVIEQAWLAP